MHAFAFVIHLSAVLQSQIQPDSLLIFWVIYTLVVYHIVLVVKIMTQPKSGMTMPLGQTILFHVACVGTSSSLSILRAEHVPFIWLIRLMLPGLAAFEAQWLFSGKLKVTRDEPKSATPVADSADRLVPTAIEYEEFLAQVRAGKRPFRKRGRSLQEEAQCWLKDRRTKQGQPI